MILLLLLLFLLQWRLSNMKEEALREARERDSLAALESRRVDSLRTLDSLRLADSLRAADSLRSVQDSLTLLQGKSRGEFDAMWKARQDSLRAYRDSVAKVRADSLAQALQRRKEDSLRMLDSLGRLDSLRRLDSLKAAHLAADSTPPTGHILPPAGRYYKELNLRVTCDEPDCQTWIALGDTSAAHSAQQPQALGQSAKVWWRLADSLGNTTPWMLANYDLATDKRCGVNAYPVPVGKRTVCVDAYEYPNQPDQFPQDMVTQEKAAQMCTKVGKRLCSLEEWQAGCFGKGKTRYPYGSRYDQTRCATAQNKVDRTGRHEECRSWWGMYDMAGNLWEWTSTPHEDHGTFYEVAGGSWNTQDESSCTSTKFSFYPQNQYPFVGFRCCADVN